MCLKCDRVVLPKLSPALPDLPVVQRKSFKQQGTFVQRTSSEKLSAVSTLERVYSTDISHNDRGHADLAVVLLRNGFDCGTRCKEIMRDPTFDPICANQIPPLVIQFCEPSGDVRSDLLFRHARSRYFVQLKTVLGVPNRNLYRL